MSGVLSNLNPDFGVTSVNYDLCELLGRAVEPG